MFIQLFKHTLVRNTLLADSRGPDSCPSLQQAQDLKPALKQAVTWTKLKPWFKVKTRTQNNSWTKNKPWTKCKS